MRKTTFRAGASLKQLARNTALLGAIGLGIFQLQAQTYQNFTISPGNGQDAQTWWNSDPACTFAANQNFGGMDYMQTQRWTWFSIGCAEGENISYLQFNLSGALSNAILTNAELQLFYPTGNPFTNTTGNNDFYVQHVTSAWSEATITWNTAPSFTTTGQVLQPAGASTTQNWTTDITGLARDWLCGGITNNGLRLVLQNPTIYRRTNFATGDNADPTLHPNLELEWATVAISSPTPQPVCAGTTVTLDADINGTPQPYTYAWYDNFGNFLGNSASISPVVNTLTVYTVYVSLNGCTASASYTVDTRNCCTPSPNAWTRYENQLAGNLLGSVFIGREKVHMDLNGAVFLPGFSNATPVADATITKVEQNGINLWTSNIGNPGNWEAAHATYPLASGNVLVAGRQNGGNQDAMVQMLDNGGNLIWTTVINQFTEQVFVPIMTQINSGNIVLACLTNGNTARPDSRISLIELDLLGNILQYESVDYGSAILLPQIHDLTATNDGGFIIAGRATNDAPMDSYIGGFVTKFDFALNHQWTNVYRHPTTSGIYDLYSGNPAQTSIAEFGGVKEDPNTGGYILAGSASDGVNRYGWLVSISNVGVVFNTNVVIISGGYNTDFKDVSVSNNGDYIITGDNYDAVFGTVNTLITRVGPGFNFIATTQHPNGAPLANRIFEVPGTNDIMVTGVNIFNNSAPFVLRTDQNGSNGCEVTLLPFGMLSSPDIINWTPIETPIGYLRNVLISLNQSCEPYSEICYSHTRTAKPGKPQGQQNQQNNGSVTLGKEEINSKQPKVFPVPANEMLSLDMGVATTSVLQLSLTDMLGRTVISREMPAGSQLIHLSTAEIPSGVYTLRISDANGLMHTQKVSINH